MHDKFIGKSRLHEKFVGKSRWHEKLIGKSRLHEKFIGKSRLHDKFIAPESLSDKKRQKPLYGGWLEDSGNGHYGGGRLGEIGNSNYVEAGLRKAETWIRNQDRRFANLRMRAKLLGSAAEVLFFRDQQRINGVQHHPTRKQNTTCPKNWQRHLNLLRHNVDALCLASV